MRFDHSKVFLHYSQYISFLFSVREIVISLLLVKVTVKMNEVVFFIFLLS